MEGDGDDYQVEDNSVAPTYADVDVPFHFEEVQFGSKPFYCGFPLWNVV